MKLEFSKESSREFTTQKQLTDNPLFIDENAIAHPSWTAGWAEKLLRHNFDIPSSMHTKSRVQHQRRIAIGTSLPEAHTLSMPTNARPTISQISMSCYKISTVLISPN